MKHHSKTTLNINTSYVNMSPPPSQMLTQTSVLVFLFVAGGDEWKLVAEKLGLNPAEILYIDNHTRNPADAVLSYVANQRALTVGDLYDVLVACDFLSIADDL